MSSETTHSSRWIPGSRWLNIGLRTAHLVTMGVLLGGHAFDVSKAELLPWLWGCIASGGALVAVESGGRLLWLHQVRGLMTLAKIVLIALVPFFWEARFPILLAVVILAGVGSHMSARYRYFSVLLGQVVRDSCGPQGGASLQGLQDASSQSKEAPVSQE